MQKKINIPKEACYQENNILKKHAKKEIPNQITYQRKNIQPKKHANKNNMPNKTH